LKGGEVLATIRLLNGEARLAPKTAKRISNPGLFGGRTRNGPRSLKGIGELKRIGASLSLLDHQKQKLQAFMTEASEKGFLARNENG